MHQILHVGLGPLGQRILTDFARRGLGRVLAAVDPVFAGRDLSELVPGLPRGTILRASLGEIEDWRAIRCALVTTRSDLAECVDTFRELLQRGCSIVSTCEELSWPWLRHPVLAQELHELAVRFGARIVGTGINPGFLMDALPVAMTSACHEVRSVQVERLQDASKRRVPFQAKVGVGLSVDEFEARVAQKTLRHVGLGESMHFVAHALGWHIERWEETIAPVLAEKPTTSALGPVAAGAARGVRQEARAWVAGRVALDFRFQATIGEAEPRDRIAIEGEPPLEVVIPGGVHGDTATSALVLNMIRPLLHAEPGLHTMSTLPLQGCVRAGT